MDTLLACRVCLITDVKMFSLKIPQLNNAYFKFTGVMDARSPSCVCYECANILLKSEQFRLKCAQANRILTCIVLENSKITKDLIKSVDRKKHGLVSNVKYYLNEQYSVDCTDVDDTKDDIDIKHEVENNDIDIEIDGPVDDTDIEQDVACAENDMKTEEINETNVEYLDFDLLESPKESKKIHKRKKTNVNLKDVMLVEKLNQEKAILEIINRKNSDNYKKSFYKCEFCFRGFVSIRTYDNHMKKHTMNGRDFECDFCHSMFETKYQISQHIQTNHKYKYKCKICAYICFHLTQARNHVLRHGGNEYPCEVCGKVYRFSTTLLVHKKIKHQTSSACDLCGETFSNEHGVFSHKGKIHIQEINEKLGPECETCGVHFASEKAWKLHLIHSSNHQNILGCKVCGDIVLNSEQLEEHLRISENCNLSVKGTVKLPKEIRCKVCNQRFDNYNHCKRHMRKEHQEFQYKCQICGKILPTQGYLYNHIRVHDGEKPYKCTKCDKSFTSYGPCYIHMQTHKGLTYECDVCSATYNMKGLLKRHMKRHVKPYKCDYCDKTFAERCEAKYHAEYVHMKKPWPKRVQSKIKKLRCKVCRHIVLNSEQLEEHLRISQNCNLSVKGILELPKKIYCKVCNQIFDTHNRCRRHMQREHQEFQYICEICGKVFLSQGLLYNHIRVHDGEKPYKCTKCDKSFTSYSSYYKHNHTHKGLTYECDICGATYNMKALLISHMKRHIKSYKCDYCDKTFAERCEAKYHAEYVHMNKPWPKRDRKIKKCDNLL